MREKRNESKDKSTKLNVEITPKIKKKYKNATKTQSRIPIAIGIRDCVLAL